MGLFSRKKKEDNKLLPLPEFPKLPGDNLPFYDEQLHENDE